MEVCQLEVYWGMTLDKIPGREQEKHNQLLPLPFPQGALGQGWPFEVGTHQGKKVRHFYSGVDDQSLECELAHRLSNTGSTKHPFYCF